MYKTTTPNLEPSEDYQAFREPSDNSNTILVHLHIVIDLNMHLHTSAILRAVQQGLPLSSLYQSLTHYGYCTPESQVYFIGANYAEIEWSPTLPEAYLMPTFWLDGTYSIEVRITNPLRPLEPEELQDSTIESSINLAEESKGKRSRERKISEVSDKVDEWKQTCFRLKTMMPDVRKISEKAAELVGIPKKSLDDYMHQIKLGRKYNFDFGSNQDTKIGILRQFNKREELKRKRAHRRSL
jgi:hypothetical protein